MADEGENPQILIDQLRRELADLRIELSKSKEVNRLALNLTSTTEGNEEREERKGKPESTKASPSWGKSASPYASNVRMKRYVEALKDSSEKKEIRDNKPVARLPQLPLPLFEGRRFNDFCGSFLRWMQLSGMEQQDDLTKMNWVIEATVPEYKFALARIAEDHTNFSDFVTKVASIFPETENDVSIRLKLKAYPVMKREQEYNLDRLEKYLVDFDTLMSGLSEDSITEQDAVLFLSSKLQTPFWKRL